VVPDSLPVVDKLTKLAGDPARGWAVHPVQGRENGVFILYEYDDIVYHFIPEALQSAVSNGDR